MNDIRRIAREIANDMVDGARKIMASDIGVNEKVGKNTLVGSDLYNQLKAGVYMNGSDMVIDIMFNHYIEFIESGRPPMHGKRPPIDVIVEWLKRKHIVSSNENIKSVAFLVSRAIWRDGYKARKVLSAFDEWTDKRFDEKWGDMIFDMIMEDVDDFFK